jgi:MHS family proline/betaine transporter-like MFS transporter
MTASTLPTAANDTIPAPRPIHPARAIAAASIGNALEWFDLIIFGFLSLTIAKNFFPSNDGTASLLLTFATFGISFVIRPLGGIFIGIYADRAGRMKAMTLAAGLMMVGTAMIAFMPSFASIGYLAPAGIVVARLMQGFAAGGEFASATAFLAEQSKKNRGFFASWQVASQGLTTLLASAAGYALARWLEPAELESWGWRLPFLFGMMIGPVALYIRLYVPETTEFQEMAPSEAPLRETLKNQRAALLIAIGASILATVSTYVVLFMPTFAVRELGIGAQDAFVATLTLGVIQMVLSPVFGWWGDRTGRIPIMLATAVGMLLLIWPMFYLLVTVHTATAMLLVQIVFGILMTGYFASQPALLSDLFPARTRSTGMSLAYNIAVTLFGGFAPFIIASLIQLTGSKMAPGYYVMIAAALSITALLAARRLKQGSTAAT